MDFDGKDLDLLKETIHEECPFTKVEFKPDFDCHNDRYLAVIVSWFINSRLMRYTHLIDEDFCKKCFVEEKSKKQLCYGVAAAVRQEIKKSMEWNMNN